MLWGNAAAQHISEKPRLQYVHEQWTVEDGLPVNSVNQIIQSPDGYLWLATFDGLVRFDGMHFTVFNTGNSTGLPSNRIVDLLEARDGSLWIRTEQGHLVHYTEGTFTHFGPALEGKKATTLYEDKYGRLWIGTSEGVFRYEEGALIPVGAGELEGEAIRLYLDRSDALWVGTTSDGLQRWKNGVVTKWTVDDGLASNKVRAFYETPDGTLWISSNGGINTYRQGQLRPFPMDQVRQNEQYNVWNLYPDRSPNAFWIGIPQRLYYYQDGRITPFNPDGPPGDTDLPTTSPRAETGPDGHTWIALGKRLYRDGQFVAEMESGIKDFLHDTEGSIWLATHSSGLNRLKPSLFTVYSEPEGLVQKNVYLVLEDHAGAMWFGTLQDGLSRFYQGVFTSYTGDALPSQGIFSIYEDHQHNLLVAHGDGVCRFTQGRCVPLEDNQGFLQDDARAMYEDEVGNLWFGTSSGLVRYHQGTWTRYTTDDGLPSNDIRYILEAQDGGLWLGTTGGLGRYHNGTFSAFTTQDGLSSNLIRSIYQDEDGLLWIGTEGRGLNRIDLSMEKPSITVFRRKDGLFDEVIHQILEDDFGRLWMSTNRGIFWVTRKGLNAFAKGTAPLIYSTSYTDRDGLRNREANGGRQPAGIKARDGRLWFPTQDGIAAIDPSNIRRNEVVPPVVIEQFATGDTVIAPPRKKLQLSAQDRDFEIAYTALSFMAPENMRFRYRLDGFDRDWVQAGSRRVAYYTNVPPGDYTFRVIASNNDGVWNDEGASLALKVTPYFYETRWFLGLCVLGFLLTGPSLYLLRVRRLKAQQQALRQLVEARTAEVVQRETQLEAQNARLLQHEAQLESQNVQLKVQALKLKELDELKSRFFANISHEFRTPLTLTIGPLEDLRAGVYGPLASSLDEQLGLALRNARRLLRLVNQILDVAKLEAGQTHLRAQEADFMAFLVGIAQAFAALAERKQITFRIALPDEPVLAYFDPDLLEKVFVNMLSNAFKFTPSGGVIHLTADCIAIDQAGRDGYMKVTVRDNGPGIPADQLPHIFKRFYQVDESQRRLQPGTGIGLSLAKELVELHGGEIAVESEQDFGTTFTVRMPLGRAHLGANQIVEAGGTGPWTAEELLSSLEANVLMAEVTTSTSGEHPKSVNAEDVTTVLVADDNADVRAYVRRHLMASYRVVEATDGREALEMAERVLPDLIISDVMMPNLDGYALCHALKKNPELNYIPVILLTAKALPEDKIAGLQKGADDYLTKPFDVKELRIRVDNLIASRRRLRERFSNSSVKLHPHDLEVISSDTAFLEQVRAVVEAHLADENFSVEHLSAEVGIDRSHLYRRLRNLQGQTPSETIRSMRLERAAQLLAGQAGLVSEVAYGVGFKSVSHFSKCFREQYGVTPSEYMDEKAEA
ncbi:MAG TPA: two-component regulator propeller domain-containing protein [Rhodothermales bacterium]|nr:two-component regulator propeller domain-containing protein [Rhodothermales bacterium]